MTRFAHPTLVATLLLSAMSSSAQTFVNWETPHVSPLAITPDATRLLAVNTADARLEIFDISTGTPTRPNFNSAIPVGIDPVSVRVRTSTEAWVVNHISDSVSIVDLSTMAVVRTLKTRDEPWDVAFANGRAFVTCGTDRSVLVYDTADLSLPPTPLQLNGEQPRAMAVSADGSKVFVAIFESGNKSTVLGGGSSGVGTLAFPPNVVGLAGTPYGTTNPPPNSGTLFDPPQTPGNPTPPRVSLIVKKNSANQWMDDNNRNWTQWVSGTSATQSGRRVGWDLYDNDIAVIDTASLDVSYINGLMNICMHVAVNPADGRVLVVGTDATNEIRFEPNLKGTFVRVKLASIDLASPTTPTISDINPHLDYLSPTLPQTQRDRSIGDPRAVIFNASGTVGYVAGMGSGNVAIINASGARLGNPGTIEVGEGPTGLALNPAGSRLYVLSKFSASISTIDTTSNTVIDTKPFHDSTPAAIKVGRRHLYDTHATSGLGQAACASCHVNATMDRLAWDLGDPSGGVINVSIATRNLGQGLIGLEPGSTNPSFQNYHPMKGPMTTQTLQDIIGKEPHHWRGDRLGIEEFNDAFVGLNGDDTLLTPVQMQEFEDFLATITFPPNPYRNLDNSLKTALPLPGHFTTGRFTAAGQPLGAANVGNALNGLNLYRSQTTRLDNNAFACVTCHTLPTGAGTDFKMTGPFTPPYLPIAPGPLGQRHLSLVSTDGTTNVTIKIPQLRNVYKKVGFNTTQLTNTAGFGLLHDGSVDSLERFIAEPIFTVTNDQQIADLTAFVLSISGSDLPQGSTTSPLEPPGPPSKDTHAAVGVQTTATNVIDTTLISSLTTLADANRIGLIAKARTGAVGPGLDNRGYKYNGAGLWQSDKMEQPPIPTANILAGASATTPITFTAVPAGAQTRLGIDRDLDTWLDSDELSVCSDPASAQNFPGSAGSIDLTADLNIAIDDVFEFLNLWFASDPRANADGTNGVAVEDIFFYLNAWFARC